MYTARWTPVASVCENQTQIIDQNEPPAKPRNPLIARRALGDGVGKIYLTFSSYFPSPHCQPMRVRGVEFKYESVKKKLLRR